MDKTRKPPLDPAAVREAKLAEALRANLRRRKTAERDPPSSPAPPEPSRD